MTEPVHSGSGSLLVLAVVFVVLVQPIGASPVAHDPAATTRATPGVGVSSTLITGCTDITRNGTYTLDRDIDNSTADTCINITASEVVLDGAGHTIDGIDAENTSGVAVHDTSLVAIRNLRVSDWAVGVFLANVTTASVNHTTASSNDAGYGILLVNTTTAAVIDNAAHDNQWNGVFTYRSSELLIANNTVRRNGFAGIGVEPGRNATIVNNTAVDNGRMGIGLKNASHHTLRDNRIRSNDATGIALYNTSGILVENNSIRDNRWWGVHVQANSRRTAVVNSTITDQYAALRYTRGSSRNLIRDTHVWNNTWVYISRDDSTNTAVDLTTASANVSFTGRDVALKSVSSPPQPPTDMAGIGSALNATNTSGDSWLNLSVHYDEADVASVNESTVGLWSHNGTTWSAVSGFNSVDPTRNVVRANITEFSVFAPLAATDAPTNRTLVVNRSDPAAYGSIATAVENATRGDTVVVHTGVYNESVRVDGNVSIVSSAVHDDHSSGPSAGAPADAAVLDGHGTRSIAFLIEPEATDVRIEGFVVRNYSWGVFARSAGSHNVTIAQNTIESVVEGLLAWSREPVHTGWTIEANRIAMASFSGIDVVNLHDSTIRGNVITRGSGVASPTGFAGGIAVLTNNGTSDTVAVRNNTIGGTYAANSSVGIVLRSGFWRSDGSADLTNVSVRGNQLRGEIRGHGIFAVAGGGTTLADVVIRNNTVNNATAGHPAVNVLSLAESHIGPLTVQHNRLAGNAYGAAIGHGPTVGTPNGSYSSLSVIGNALVNNTVHGVVVTLNASGDDLTIHENVIEGNGRAGLSHNGSGRVDARANWWGATDGPAGAFNGSGDAVIGNVTVNPFYTDANRTTLSRKLIVNQSDPSTYDSIQDAIDNSSAGDWIEVHEGSYNSSLEIDKNVTIYSVGDVILDGSSSSSNTGVQIAADSPVSPTIQDITIRDYSIGVNGTLSSGDWFLRNITIEGVGGIGVDSEAATGDWRIQNADIRDVEVGVRADHTIGTWRIQRSFIHGNLGHGILTSYSTQAWTIRNTRIQGMQLSGIQAEFTEGDWKITNTTIKNGTGIGINTESSTANWSISGSKITNIDRSGRSFLAGDGSGIYAVDTAGEWEIHQSLISNTAALGINATDTKSLGNATHNWWGASDGPSGDFTGSGDEVVGNVAARPFYTDAKLTTLSSQSADVVVTGRINESDGHPAAHDSLALFAEGPLPGEDQFTSTNASGYFAVQVGTNTTHDLQYYQANFTGPGTVAPGAWPRDRNPDVLALNRVNTSGVSGQLDLGGTTLPLGYTVNVTAVDENGTPVPNATFWVTHHNAGDESEAGLTEIAANDQGMLTLANTSHGQPGIELVGNVTVRANPPGTESKFVQEWQGRTLTVTSNRSVTIELKDRPMMTGRLLEPGGTAAANDTVVTFGSESADTYFESTLTSSKGRFTLHTPPAPDVDITFYQGTFANDSHPFAPRDGVVDFYAVTQVDTTEGDVPLGNSSLPEGHVLNVTVVDSTGAPVANASLSLDHYHGSINPEPAAGPADAGLTAITTNMDGAMVVADHVGIELTGNVTVTVEPPANETRFVDRTYLRNLTITNDTDITIQLEERLPVICSGCAFPTDPDNDGRLEDLNGNGELDFNDIVVMFTHILDPAVADHVSSYDFNRNGRIDFDDVVTLFEEI